jgi:hypothetical protein
VHVNAALRVLWWGGNWTINRTGEVNERKGDTRGVDPGEAF